MQFLRVLPCESIEEEITVPGDKSISHRAMLLSALANGNSRIQNVLTSEDCINTADSLRALGVIVQHSLLKNEMQIQGVGRQGLKPPVAPLNCGNSGTGIRLLLGLLAGQDFSAQLTGDEYLQKRPMNRVVLPLKMMGAKIQGVAREDRSGAPNLFPPLTITGTSAVKGITYELPIASAQVKSAILIAGLFAQDATTVLEPVPTRDHTERLLHSMGLTVEIRTQGQGQAIRLHPADLRPISLSIPGDISAAAFWLVAASIVSDSRLIIRDVGLNPTRTGVLDVLKRMGAKFFIEKERWIGSERVGDLLVQQAPLTGTVIAGPEIPRLIDEIPILAVAAACASGQTVVRDAGELRVKESDRIKTVVSQLLKMGVDIHETEDGMVINGNPHSITGGKVSSHGDHRIAMAAAVLGLVAQGETIIEDTACIATSYPGFERTLRQILMVDQVTHSLEEFEEEEEP